MMIPGIAAGLFLPFAATLALLRLLLPALWLRSRTLVISLAIVAGIGLSSLLFAISIFAFGPRWKFYVALEITLWVVVIYASLRASRDKAFELVAPSKLSWIELAAALVFAAALTVSLLHFYLWTANSPSGTWDAWAIWNLRARFLHRGLEGHWRDAFQIALGWSHPNYPLMLPSSTARLWLYAGRESSMGPIALAFLFEYSTVGILVGALMAMGRRLEGFLAGATLLASYLFNLVGVGQISDVPVGTFAIAAIVLLAWIIDEPGESATTAAVVAFCAGCAAWTKNEGLVLAIAICMALGIVVVWRRREIVRTLAFSLTGLLLPLAVLFYFKRTLAPPSYLLEGFAGNRWPSQLWDVQRHAYILRSFGRELWAWGTTKPVGIIPIIVSYGVSASVILGIRAAKLVILVPVLAMLAGYYGAYVVTPLDLKWHIESSLSRLIVQIWPSIVFVAFCVPAEPLLSDPQI